MKKYILMSVIAIASYSSQAQVSVNINIGSQPVWGPVGYDYVQYYYIPDIDAYYDVPHRQYVYLYGGRWVYRRTLPPRYAHYDIYNGYKVVINEPRPWMHHDRYVREYAGYRGRHGQAIIRDSRDERYYVNPHHPQHNVWMSHHPAPPRQVGPPPPRMRDARPMPPGHDRGPGGPGRGPGGPGPGPRPGGPGGPGGPGHGEGHGHGDDHGHGHR